MAEAKPENSTQDMDETSVKDKPAATLSDTGAPATVSDDNGVKRQGFEKEQFEQNAVGRFMQAFMKRLEFLAQKGGDVIKNNGAIGNSRSATAKYQQEELRRKKDKEAMSRALKEAQKRLDELDRQLQKLMDQYRDLEKEANRLGTEIEKDQKALNATNKLIELRNDKGSLDLTDPYILSLLDEAGISVDDYKKDPEVLGKHKEELEQRILSNEDKLKIVKQKMDDIHKEIEQIKQEKADLIKKNPELKKQIEDKIDAERDELIKQREKLLLEKEQLENAIEQPTEQKDQSPAQDMMPQGDTSFEDFGFEDEPSSPDEEVGAFIREHAKIKGDTVREQELVEGLSEEAAELMATQEDTKHLFEDGYFEQSKASPLTDHEFKSEGLNADQNEPSTLSLGRG